MKLNDRATKILIDNNLGSKESQRLKFAKMKIRMKEEEDRKAYLKSKK
jgi:hypothetical protein